MAENRPLNHLVLIPDGDRRWAKENGMLPWEGHRQGIENIRMVLDVCKESNIHYLTMWAFSTENWKRDQEEVGKLMEMLLGQLHTRKSEFLEKKVRFRHIGRKDRLSNKIVEGLIKLEQATQHFTEWNFSVCLDYGGQDEIARATQKVATEVLEGRLKIEEINPQTFSQFLDTKDLPDPDLLVRTSGEQRTSGLLPFQSVYAELLFVPVYFPALTADQLKEIIAQYNERQRRFGC